MPREWKGPDIDYDLGGNFFDLTADDAYSRVLEKAKNRKVVLCTYNEHLTVKVIGIHGIYLIVRYTQPEYEYRGEYRDGTDTVLPHCIYPEYPATRTKLKYGRRNTNGVS